jgi:phosphoribosylamine--glycine ligase
MPWVEVGAAAPAFSAHPARRIAQRAGRAGLASTARLADLAEREKVGLTVVGPEAPLAAGIVDVFQARGLRVFGPTHRAATLESSKAWAKDLLSRYDIPTGYFATFDQPRDAMDYVDLQEFPVVVKADGLAAGKGVTVARTREEAEEAIQDSLVRGLFGESGRRVVIEQYLEGEELSVMALADGGSIRCPPRRPQASVR